jgi:RNA polymerase sigma-70 factor (ECF subfamily)
MNYDRAAELVSSLFESWYSTLIRYAYRNTGKKEIAHDAVQQTFMALYEALIKGQEIRSPKAWTLCVLRRELRLFRDEEPDYQPLDTLESVKAGCYEPSFVDLECDEVLRALGALTVREQEAILLRMEAMKYREIAEAMGISTNSVNVLLSRAVLKLREVFRKAETVVPHEGKHKRHAPKTLQ